MFTALIITLLCILTIFGILAYFYNKWVSTWHYVKASKLKMSLFEFMYQYAEMTLRKIPASLIFNLMVSAQKGGAVISLKILKDFYLLIDRTVERSIDEFNKSKFKGELILKRIGGFFILSGTINGLVKKIIDANTADKDPLIQGNRNNVSEKITHHYLNEKIKTYRKVLEKVKDVSLVDLEKAEKSKEDKNDKKDSIIRADSKEKEDIKLAEKILKFHTSELLSELKSGNIYMSKGSDIKLFIRKLFESTSKALIKAQQAGLDIRFDDLEVHFGTNGDIETTLIHLIDAKNVGLVIELKELEKYLLLGGDISEVVKALIRLSQEKILDITIKDLSEYLSQGGDVSDVVNNIIILKQAGIDDIKLGTLNSFRIAGGDINKITLALIKGKQANLKLKTSKLKSFLVQGGNIYELVTVLIKTKNAKIDLSFDEFVDFFSIGANISKIYVAFKIAKLAKITDAEKNKLIEIQVAGGEMFDYVKVLSLAKRLKLDINPDELEADVIEGRNVIKVTFAALYARKQGLDFDYKKAIRHDREGRDVAEIVQWAVNPQVIAIEPNTILSKDGVSVKIFTNVTVKGKIDMYLRGSRNEVLTTRVNEAIIKELERIESYHDALDSLNKIAYNVFKRLTGTMEFEDFPELEKDEITESNKNEIKINAGSAYQVLEINIPRLEIGSDAYADIKKEHAEIKKLIAETESEERKALAKAMELEAKAKLIEAEAKLNEGMAHAFKKGYLDTKEYHKKKIFDDEDLLKDSQLPKGGH